MIKIIGLGPGNVEALTLGAINQLKKSSNLILRTKRHPVAEYLKNEKIKFESYDYIYENKSNFSDIYNEISKDLINKYLEFNEITYAVPGNPLEDEKTVNHLISICKSKNIPYKIIPAVSFLDEVIRCLEIDVTNGIQIIDAFDINSKVFNNRVEVLIAQLNNTLIASEVKCRLLEYYNKETEVFYCKGIGMKVENIRKISLYELDMQDDLGNFTFLYIPKNSSAKKDIYDLMDIIDLLRSENGCPWDREQDHFSIRKAVIEESYEVCDAIETDNLDALVEELGDVLLQVVFHASLGKDNDTFSMSDVIEGICNKMIYRHPHVFKDEKVNGTNEVLSNWDELKKKEKHFETVTDELKGVAKALPALIRANKVQSKAKKVGFDWDDVEGPIKKVKEELNEVIDVYKTENKARITEEIGDLIFSCVNVSRFLKVDAEEALNKTTDKFIKRFNFIEEKAKEKGMKLENMVLNDMNKLWNEAKK